MKHRDQDNISNPYFTLSDLGLIKEQEEAVLMWFARKLWVILEEGSGEPDYYCKVYDPLLISGNLAYSYVFNFEDGGRHHPFESLEQLEEMLVKEGIVRVKELIQESYEA